VGPFCIDEDDDDDNDNNKNNTISYVIFWNNIHFAIALSDISTALLLLPSPPFKQST